MSDIKHRLPLFIFLALLVLAAVYYALVYVPLQEKVADLSAKCDALKLEMQTYDAYISKAEEIRAAVDALKAETDNFRADAFRVGGKNLIYEIQNSILASGVMPSSIDINDPGEIYSSSGVSINVLSFDINFSCNYEQLQSFLEFYENSPDTYFHVLSVDTGDLMTDFSARASFVMYYPEKAANNA